jgi:hypothetical protein
MIDYHDCGFQLQVEYRDDAGALTRVYFHDGRQVTECPMCGAPLPTDVMQPDPAAENDDLLWDDADIEWPPWSPDSQATPDHLWDMHSQLRRAPTNTGDR